MLKKVACVLLLVACDSDESVTTEMSPPTAPARAPSETVTAETTPSVTPPVAPAAAPAVAAPAVPVAPANVASSWRDRVTADLASLRTSSPKLLADLTALAPSRTRAGMLRFTSDAVHDPRAASVFIDRLARAGEAENVRAALVEALPRTGGVFADAAVQLIATEPSPIVRGAYVFAARRAPGTHAIALMKRGFADDSPEVQAEAARSAAAHPEGKRLAGELLATLTSPSAAVRTEGARSLGILKVAGARDALVANLSDTSADVRLESLRAIDRIEPGAARTLPLAKLANDEDPRVTALVTRLTAPPPAK